MAAGVMIGFWGSSASTGPAAGGTNSSAETTGFCFNRSALRSGTSEAIPIPTSSAGVNYSYPKFLALYVTSSDATTISNRQVSIASTQVTGLRMYWDSTSVAAYTTPAAVISAANTSADDVVPGGAGSTAWVLLTTAFSTASAYSTADSSGGTTGINGTFLVLGIGVSSTGTYTGGPGSAIALANVSIQYDEAFARQSATRADLMVEPSERQGRWVVL